MGLFDKLRRAFSGQSSGEKDEGLYVYVRLDVSGEVVRLRIDPSHELNPDYDEGGYVSRKTIIGPRSFRRAEATFRFDASRSLTSWDVTGGTAVSQAEWEAQQAPSSGGGGAGVG